MKQIGAYEAKTHLSRILNEVAKGKQFAITKHSVVIALIVPPREQSKKPLGETIEEILEFRKRHKVSANWIRSAIALGRK